MDAKLHQFIGCRSANPAGSACDKCRQRIGSHLQFSFSDFAVAGRNLRVKWLRIRPNENKLSRHWQSERCFHFILHHCRAAAGR
jgi:hypothetical protein